MDLTKLRNNQIQLIEHMKKGGYSETYISKVNNEINKLLVHGKKYENYLEYYEKFIKPKCNLKNQRHKIGFLTLIMNFDLYDELPSRNHHKHKLIDNSNYHKLNSYYKSIIEYYEKTAIKMDKKTTTIHNEAFNCSCFLFYCQNKGYDTLKNIDEKTIINFFIDDKEQLKFSNSYVKNIRIVLKTSSIYFQECQKVVELLPKIKYFRKNIDYLTKEEINEIKNVLNNKSSNVCLRDKAIVSLLLYTGLRSCDIVNLKLSNIDWNNEIINIIQTKTDVPLEIPLTISVGNALFEYIIKERPKVDFDNVFIRIDTNYPITKSSNEVAVRKVFKEAKIRQNNKKRKGTHIFRYNLATSLLKNEIPQPIISQVLGHISQTSLNFYLSADFYHLKQCSLDIEQFENINEVYHD